MKHVAIAALSAAFVSALAGVMITSATAQTQPPVERAQPPKPTTVPTDLNTQRLPNRDNSKPDNAPTDPRNSQNKDGNPNTSN